MKPTPTALAGRILQSLSKLHPPSGAPTTRESNQLLKTLQMSFQKELDTTHPDPKVSQNVAKSVGLQSSVLGESNLKDVNEQHWSTIAMGMNPAAASKQRVIVKLEKLLGQPAVNIGELDSLLQLYLTISKKESNSSQHDAVYDRLDRWLWNTDTKSRNMFFESDCLHTAMRTMWFQKNETLAWKWLNAVYQRESIDAPITSRTWLYFEDVMVSTLMRISISAKRLDDAATQFIYASQYRIESGRIPSKDASKPLNETDLLRLSSRVLCQSILQAGTNHGIETETFDTMMQYLQPAGHVPLLEKELCAVYHPDTSNYHSLSLYLQAPAHIERLQQAKSSFSDRHVNLWSNSLKHAAEAAMGDQQPHQAMLLLNTALDLGLANNVSTQELRARIQKVMPATSTSRGSFRLLKFSNSTHTKADQFVPSVT